MVSRNDFSNSDGQRDFQKLVQTGVEFFVVVGSNPNKQPPGLLGGGGPKEFNERKWKNNNPRAKGKWKLQTNQKTHPSTYCCNAE